MSVVLVADLADEPDYDLAIEHEVLGANVELRRFRYDGDDTALVAAGANAGCILSAYVPFTATTLAGLSECKLISVAATGYDHVDIVAATDLGIRVCALNDYCTDEVADHTLMLILALARRLTEYHSHVQHDHRWHYDALSGLSKLRGQTLGIVGYGKIGRAVALRAQGFGVDVIASDPNVAAEDNAPSGVELVALEELLARSDIISLHCNHTAENDRLINTTTIAKMRKRPFLINVSRGGLVDETALADALDSGWISAAGLDVLDSETPNLANNGLVGRSNVLLTPHAAFYSDASIDAIHRVSAQNVRHFLDGNHDDVDRYVAGAASTGRRN